MKKIYINCLSMNNTFFMHMFSLVNLEQSNYKLDFSLSQIRGCVYYCDYHFLKSCLIE